MRRPPDLAVDLGNANTRVYVPGRGVVVEEPSVVALDRLRRRPLAVGTPAKAMLGRSPHHIEPIQPLKHGVVQEVEVAGQMMASFLRTASRRSRPRVLLSVPVGVMEFERRTACQTAELAGAGSATVIEEPLAAAIGSGLAVGGPDGVMVVDVGAGITEAVVVALGGIVASRSLRVGGDEMDSAIVEWAREERGMSIGLPTAERLKLQVGSAVALNEEPVMEVAGLHLASGLPRRMHVHGREVREAIEPVVQQMVAVAAAVLDVTPPELSADLGETGIVLTGGVARLAGLAERVAEATSLPVRVGDRPERAVVTGCGRCVEEPYLLAAALS